jgi:ABC-type proline/glycine betaine transport system ATPase subunit
MNDDINERSVNPLIRIAETLEEILRLVKLDQEKMAKRFPDEDQE